MPANKDTENEFDGIRVVEDTEEEEVVRLDVSEAGTLTMKEPSKEEMAMPNMMGDTDVDEVPETLGPESEWLVTAEAKEVTSVPMGWFVLLFAVLGGVLIWAFSQRIGEGDGAVDAGALPKSMIDQEAYDQLGQSVFRNSERIQSITTRNLHSQILSQRQNVASPISQRRNRSMQQIQPMIQVFAKFAAFRKPF